MMTATEWYANQTTANFILAATLVVLDLLYAMIWWSGRRSGQDQVLQRMTSDLQDPKMRTARRTLFTMGQAVGVETWGKEAEGDAEWVCSVTGKAAMFARERLLPRKALYRLAGRTIVRCSDAGWHFMKWREDEFHEAHGQTSSGCRSSAGRSGTASTRSAMRPGSKSTSSPHTPSAASSSNR
jgi:hypothetical protein